MISFYGVKSMATRYLQEMYVGLKTKRKQVPIQKWPSMPCAVLHASLVLHAVLVVSS